MFPSRTGRQLPALGLAVANAIPLVGVVAFGWELHSLLVLYWVESAVIGLESIAKIRRAAGEDDPGELPNLKLNEASVTSFVGASKTRITRFFVFHYGGFWLVHGLFVLIFPFVFPGMEPGSPTAVLVPALGLGISHAISYRIHYIGGEEYLHTGPVTQMVEPYRRVFVLHLTVVLGAFAIASLGTPVGMLVVLVLAKTVLDLRGHWKEHDRAKHRRPVDPV